MIRRECLELVRKEEEASQGFDLLPEEEINLSDRNLQSPVKLLAHYWNNLRDHSVQQSVHHPLFPPPTLQPLHPTLIGLLQFSNLFCFSGRLVQSSQGQHDSKQGLCLRWGDGGEQDQRGHKPERNLVREELGLWDTFWKQETSLCFFLERPYLAFWYLHTFICTFLPTFLIFVSVYFFWIFHFGIFHWTLIF